MIRKSMGAMGVVIASTLSLSLGLATAGCNTNAADKEKEAQKAQMEADQKRAQADQKTQADKSDDLAAADKAQQKAVDLLAEATQALDKERADYKDKVTKQISDLDGKIAELRASVDNGAPAKKAEYERYMTAVQSDRDRLDGDLRSIDNAGDATAWNDLKKKIDGELDAFKKDVRTASSNIKTKARTVRVEPVPNDKRVNTPNVYQGPPMPNPATPVVPPITRGTTPSTPRNAPPQ
jgi:chromosome segregation ATPase